MAPYVLRRLLAAIPVFIGVTLVTFLVMHFTAGSFVPGLDLNPGLKPEDIARIRANLGLDRPLYVQYATWLWNLAHGDLGQSLIKHKADSMVQEFAANVRKAISGA